jgi:hypothetical protein
MLLAVPHVRASSWLVPPLRLACAMRSAASVTPTHADLGMPGSEVRCPSPPSPPEPPRTRAQGLGPRSWSSCVWLLACSLARTGSAEGGGGGAGRDATGGEAVAGVASSSVYAQAFKTPAEPTRTSNSVMPRTCFPPPMNHMPGSLSACVRVSYPPKRDWVPSVAVRGTAIVRSSARAARPGKE